ncbi:MAG: ribonuclease P protein component 1 [Candidatus Bathyarchaeota archaeon]|nr:ribonuclease P protein component 1 [Candidatus Bathyarchaeota archaeon]
MGLKAKVVRSSNPSYLGISGRVIDETRNTLVIRHQNKDKVIVKEAAVFQFNLPDGTVVEIEGNVILGRPEDRVKKRQKRRW